MIFKLFGLGFSEYSKDRFNVFDAFIVLMSYVDALMPAGNEKLKIKMKIETFLEKNSRKIKRQYTILQVIEIFEEKDLFNYDK